MEFSIFVPAAQKGDEPYVIDLQRLIDCYRAVRDHRHARGVRYPLWLLLIIATLAKLVGVNSVQELADWAQQRRKELGWLFRFWRGRMPVLKTWTDVFARAVDGEELMRQVGELWSPGEGPGRERGSVHVAMDGKWLRGSSRVGAAGTYLLAVYRPDAGLVLAQVAIASKTNELEMAPQVLATLELHGKVVTGDALFAQRQLSAQIVAAGGDYLWRVKGNQPRLKEQIATVFTPQPVTPGWGTPPSEIERVTPAPEKGHGRLEQRTLSVSSILQGYGDWPHLAQVFQLETKITHLTSGKVTRTVCYGVTSLPRSVADPQRVLELIRQHWQIESALHYRRDMTFAEDRGHICTGHAAQLNAVLNNIAIACLHHCPAPSLPAARRALDYAVARMLTRASLT